MTKFTSDRPFSDPKTAARKLIEIANATEAVQDGRIYIEKINGRMLFVEKATPAEYKAGPRSGDCPRRAARAYKTSNPNFRDNCRAILSRRGLPGGPSYAIADFSHGY